MGSPASSGRVRLFGSVRLDSPSGEVLALPSSSLRRLVAVLALADGATRRAEHLSDLLGVSVGALRTSVCRLRRRVGVDVVRTDAAGYRLLAGTDLVEFEDLVGGTGADRLGELDAALALSEDDLLDEFRHERWAQASAARIDELRRLAVEERAGLLTARGRPGEAIAALEAHLAADPLRDGGWCLLAQALASDGRQAEALRAVQTYRTILAEETGTVPSDRVRAVESRVAAGWPAGGRDPAGGERPGSRPRRSRPRSRCGVDRRRRHVPPHPRAGRGTHGD